VDLRNFELLRVIRPETREESIRILRCAEGRRPEGAGIIAEWGESLEDPGLHFY
jgi:hypothetical protein